MGPAENLSPNTVVHRRKATSSNNTNTTTSSTHTSNDISSHKITNDTSPSLGHPITSSDDVICDREHSTLDLVKTVTELQTSHLSHDDELKKLKEIGAKTPILPSQIGTDFNFKREIVWSNAIGFAALHLCAVIGVILGLFLITDIRTSIYGKDSDFLILFDFEF